MSIAIDFGVHEIRSLRCQSSQLVSRKARSVYASLPISAAREEMLKKLGITYAICEESLVIIGEDAEEYAKMFQVPVASLLQANQVPADDPPARQILGAIVDSLLPEPTGEQEICCMTLPVNISHRPQLFGESNRFLERLISLRGYRPLILSEGMAVVLAEMASDSFTGIGMSMGAGSCELILSQHGEEIACYTVLRGGDWIDEQLAHHARDYAWDVSGNQYLDSEKATQWKENCNFNLSEPGTEQESLLAELYSELTTYVLQQASSQFSKLPELGTFPQPISLVCAGGMTRIPGFEQFLRQQLLCAEMPIEIDHVRINTDSTHTITRGCLIKAELESEQREPFVSAA